MSSVLIVYRHTVFEHLPYHMIFVLDQNEFK